MKEVLFKYIFILVLINNFCFTESVNPNSYSYIFNNFISETKYKNNIGLQFSMNENNVKFHSQNWISDNLYLGGILNFKSNDIRMNYSLNIGYKIKELLFESCSIIYDFGIHNQRILNSSSEKKDLKWKKISMFFNFKNNISITYNYIYSKCSAEDINDSISGCKNSSDTKDAKFITFDLFNYINNNYIVNIGIKKSEAILYPYLSFWYSL